MPHRPHPVLEHNEAGPADDETPYSVPAPRGVPGDASDATSVHAGSPAGNGEVAQEHAGLPQLRFETFPSQIFWLAIVFVALYVILSRLTLPKISRVIETRDRQIEGDLAMAEHAQSQAEAAKDTYERTQAEARRHAQELMDGVQNRVRQVAEQTQHEMDATLRRNLADAERGVETAKATAMQQFVPAATNLAAALVQKITQATADTGQLDAAIAAATAKRLH